MLELHVRRWVRVWVNMDKWTATLYLKQLLGGLAGDDRALPLLYCYCTKFGTASSTLFGERPPHAGATQLMYFFQKLLFKCPHCPPWRSLPDMVFKPKCNARSRRFHRQPAQILDFQAG